jgi:hypothetical protein
MTLKSLYIYETNLYIPDSTTKYAGAVRTLTGATALVIGGTANAEATEAEPNTFIPIRVSGTRKYGITARHIIIGKVLGATPNQYVQYRKVVIFQIDLFAQFLSSIDDTITYDGTSGWYLVGGSQERYHLTLATG